MNLLDKYIKDKFPILWNIQGLKGEELKSYCRLELRAFMKKFPKVKIYYKPDSENQWDYKSECINLRGVEINSEFYFVVSNSEYIFLRFSDLGRMINSRECELNSEDVYKYIRDFLLKYGELIEKQLKAINLLKNIDYLYK